MVGGVRGVVDKPATTCLDLSFYGKKFPKKKGKNALLRVMCPVRRQMRPVRRVMCPVRVYGKKWVGNPNLRSARSKFE